MRRAKVDGNQPEIVAALRRAGAYVELLHRVGAGCPDLFVTYARYSTLMEVKMPGEKLNALQQSWHLAYFLKTGEEVPVVHSIQEAFEIMGIRLNANRASKIAS
jgi:hypothetical protein